MEHIHTRIDNPLELRKDILEAAIEATEMLKANERILELDKDREMFKKEIAGMITDLRASVAKLEKTLPPLPQEFKKQKQSEETPVIRDQSYLSDREKLENDLEKIRTTLARIRH